jgi:hypothetical protein
MISRRVGGSGGRFAGSYAGGSFRVTPSEAVLKFETLALPKDAVETVETWEISDDVEFLRMSVEGAEPSVGRRSGRAGDV